MLIRTDPNLVIPPPTLRRTQPSVDVNFPGPSLSAARIEEIPPQPPTQHGYWPLFLLDQENGTKPKPVPPARAAELISAGDATLADRDAAFKAVVRLRDEARLIGTERAAYEAVIGAQDRRTRRARADRARATAGLLPDDEYGSVEHAIPVQLFTMDDMVRIFRVDERTIRRWDGQAIPRGIRIGGVVRWKASAVLSMLERAA